MTGGKQVHSEELVTDVALVRRLVASQFPMWAEVPVVRLLAASTDNDIYRLGPDMAVRLPRRASAETPLDKEYEWLPRVASHITVAVSLPLAKGSPDESYPYRWSVVRWIEGELPPWEVNDPAFARDVAEFVVALQALDARDGPIPGAHNFWRGVPLAARDASMRQRFGWLSDVSDVSAIISEWDAALKLPEWDRAPVWTHGDLQRGNLLVRDGRLAGVLDWSALSVGDPAGDLSLAWSLLGSDARATYREVTAADDATWARGRAWALIEGVLAFSYYRGKSDVIAQAGRRVIDIVLADHT
jgi:aminoglycoside phosphotransferase (APT) family kinase protein